MTKYSRRSGATDVTRPLTRERRASAYEVETTFCGKESITYSFISCSFSFIWVANLAWTMRVSHIQSDRREKSKCSALQEKGDEIYEEKCYIFLGGITTIFRSNMKTDYTCIQQQLLVLILFLNNSRMMASIAFMSPF